MYLRSFEKRQLDCTPFIQIFSSFLLLSPRFSFRAADIGRCVQPLKRARARARACRRELCEWRESQNECRSGYRIISMEVGSYERVQAFRTLLIFPFFLATSSTRHTFAETAANRPKVFCNAWQGVAIRIDKRSRPVRLHRPDSIEVIDKMFPIVCYLVRRQHVV